MRKELTETQIQNLRNWIKALRSGDYKQGEGCLYNNKDDSFCCLGVACDLFQVPYNKSARQYVFEVYGDVYFENKLIPGINFEEMFGLTVIFGDELASMNDVNQYSFADIATEIENEVFSQYGITL